MHIARNCLGHPDWPSRYGISEQNLQLLGYSSVPTALQVLGGVGGVRGRRRYCFSPERRAARGDRSPTGGVVGSSMVGIITGNDRRTSTRVVVARPAFRLCVTYICSFCFMFCIDTQHTQIYDSYIPPGISATAMLSYTLLQGLHTPLFRSSTLMI